MDAEVEALIKADNRPTLEAIVALAKKAGIKNPAPFWEFFDLLWARWREYHSCESFGELS